MAALGRWRALTLVAGGMLTVLVGGSGGVPIALPFSAAPDHPDPTPTAPLRSVTRNGTAVLPNPGVAVAKPENHHPSVVSVMPGAFATANERFAPPGSVFDLPPSARPVQAQILIPQPDLGIPNTNPGAVVHPTSPTDGFQKLNVAIPAPAQDFSIPVASKIPNPQPPAEPEITEPVSTVHRFAGTYLGGDDRRLLVYTETGDGRAEVQSRPIAHPIPKADTDGKDDVTRVEVPAGRVTRHDRLAFVTATRELVAINSNSEIEWRFALPGKSDNGESLLDVSGFHKGQVFVASQQLARADKEEALGRVYALDVDTGRLTAFTTITGGFDADARLTLDGPHDTLFSLGKSRVMAYGLAPHFGRGEAKLPALPIAHAMGTHMTVCATTARGLSLTPCAPVTSNALPAVRYTVSPVLIQNVAGTAPVAMRFDDSRFQARVYAPIKSAAGHFELLAIDSGNATPAWQVRVPKAITVTPVLHGSSVYFVAGNTLYRVNAGTGAVCWKHTIPLAPSELLTDLAFVRGEIRASGPGVFVRVAERTEPITQLPNAPANPVSRTGVPHPPDPSPLFLSQSP